MMPLQQPTVILRVKALRGDNKNSERRLILNDLRRPGLSQKKLQPPTLQVALADQPRHRTVQRIAVYLPFPRQLVDGRQPPARPQRRGFQVVAQPRR